MKLTIFYLTDNSRHYTFKHFVDLLKSSNKKYEWSLLILTHSNDKAFYINELENTNIIFDIFNVPSDDNYMVKVKLAIEYAEKNNTPYLMKCDNDIFITSQTLDYMIDNLSILDNSKYLTLGPTLSSGIPGVEYFMQKYLSEDETAVLEKKFLETAFYNRDGAIYDNLNVFTLNSSKWDKNSFFNAVKLMNHHYKGIHPIRINYDAIEYLNSCILNNKDIFFKSKPTTLILNDTSPYLCDSIFCIRTDIYKNIIYDTSLFVDGYDEVPLNKYAWNNSMTHAFVENGFGIHILYNWYSNLSIYENKFCNMLFNMNNTPFIEILKKYSSINTSYGTDKNTSHSYGDIYEELFFPLKGSVKGLLEIGFDSGASLQVYSEFFTSATIYGIDINNNCIELVKRNKSIKLVFGDAKSEEIINYYKTTFDIIIEDASHLLNDQVTHFYDYSNFVKENGYYIIEDVHEENMDNLKSVLEPIAINRGFTLSVIDLRKIKNRFDDILFVFKKAV